MYGSTHTHFESQYDTGNNKKEMIKRFIDCGAKKVAVTEHGVFSSYEDLKEIVNEIKEDAKKHEEPVPDFDIIPGVEGYFGEEAAHLILIAKDYEGYVSLCKIISESNKNIVNEKPIITLENLKKNVNKGHLICTSACIAGPFGRIFGLKTLDLNDKVSQLEKELEESGYEKYLSIIDEYEKIKKQAKEIRPTKAEIDKANKLSKKNGDNTQLFIVQQNIQEADKLDSWLKAHEEEKIEAEKALAKMKKAVYARKLTALNQYKNDLAEYETKKASGEIEMEAYELLDSFVDIFGKNNFYFELQNHDIDKERILYNAIVKFAYRAQHPNFIASNDIHIGVRKEDENYEDMLLRRNVIKYTRFNQYEEETQDDKEYTIKNNEELKEELLKIIEPVEDGVRTIPAEEIIDNAINNIKNCLSQCEVEFPQNENHYPKFCDDENAEFEKKVREGIRIKFPNGFPQGKEKEYEERLEYELNIIKTMGYAGYHLIVADYLTYGRLLGYLPTAEEIANAPLTIEELDKYITRQEYPRIGYNIGPGRGSAVGSLCCYLLGITDIDPIPYGLLFERFLNVERVSMPDIDSDFRTDIRDKVIDYCRGKYGAECICQIMTKSYGSTKGNLRLAARYLGSIECEKDEKYKELENEYKDLSVLIVSNPEVKFGKLAIQNKIKELEKTIKSETDEETKTFLKIKLESLDRELADLTQYGEQAKEEFSQRKVAIKEEMDNYLKTWYARADKLSKLYDELGEVLPDIHSLSKEEQEIVILAEKLEGVFTGYGQHAAGTIISSDMISNIIPLMWNKDKKAMETQCTMAQAEAKGLLKMDFLNLKNLNIITEIMRKPTKKSDIDRRLQDYEERNKILKDLSIYHDIFCTGLTQGIFQFESVGMKKMLVDFQPESFEDIILLVAAYRPGPLDYIPEIIASKWFEKVSGNYEKYSEIIKKIYPFSPSEYERKKQKGLAYFYDKDGNVLDYVPHSITLKNATLQKILEPTYGCPIYQEQIMQIFQQMAGYSLGGADVVRRYMSKKKEDKLKKEKQAFIYGDEKRNIPGCCKLHHISEKEAADLFEQMMPFAKYGFNKSHATAYAMVAMFTAYLKKYHTADFFRSSLNAVEKLTEIPDFVKEMPAFGLELKAPSMFESQNAFTVSDDEKSIIYGLKYIKGFSEQNIHRCNNIQEFIETNPQVSLKIVEKYIQLGMFQYTWKTKAEKRQIVRNRHECLRWLKENGEYLKKYLERLEKTDNLEIRLSQLDAKIHLSVNEEEEASLTKEYNKIHNQLEQETKKRRDIAKILNKNKECDFANSNVVKETTQELLENREWEVEMLSIPFDIKDSLKKISSCNNKKTFDSLKTPKKDNHDSNTMLIPAIILSISKEKKAKKSGKPYYDVMLMDSTKNIITRRFDTKPDVLDGEFALVLDEVKYFNCSMKEWKEIELPRKGTEFLPFHASLEQRLMALKNGGTVEDVIIAGRKAVPVIAYTQSNPGKEEEKEL